MRGSSMYNVCSHSNIKTFQTVNKELTHVNEWFKVNKLSLNTSKTKYTFFINFI